MLGAVVAVSLAGVAGLAGGCATGANGSLVNAGVGGSVTGVSSSSSNGTTSSGFGGATTSTSGPGGTSSVGGSTSSLSTSTSTGTFASGSTSSTSTSTGTSTSASTTSSSTGGGSCDFTASDSCEIPSQNLSTIAGDEDGSPETVTGTKSAWFMIKIEEDDSSFIPQDLSFTATLTSPPGETFQLFGYEGSSSGPDCTATPIGGTSGSTSTIDEDWGDSLGTDDSQYWMLEVRHISGGETEACDPSATWSLTIQGNTG